MEGFWNYGICQTMAGIIPPFLASASTGASRATILLASPISSLLLFVFSGAENAPRHIYALAGAAEKEKKRNISGTFPVILSRCSHHVKSHRDDMIIARGKRFRERHPGLRAALSTLNFPPSTSSEVGRVTPCAPPHSTFSPIPCASCLCHTPIRFGSEWPASRCRPAPAAPNHA